MKAASFAVKKVVFNGHSWCLCDVTKQAKCDWEQPHTVL